ncbi:MAG: hypothetical protein HYY32_00980, partial [Chloroflexi bacterium]|nr:hypothetical protein [Chloroflexota bacterium]
MPAKQSVRLGSTEVEVDSLVRDSRGVSGIIADDLDADFQEARLKNFNQRLFPFADATDIAEWDGYLVSRFAPLYLSFDATCSDCPLGPCNLKNAVGQCGLSGAGYQARLSLRRTCRGCVSQMADSRDIMEHASKVFGDDATIVWGKHHDRSDASHIGLLTAMWPRTVGDLRRAMEYAEAQLGKMFLGSFTGYDALELERMALHAGSILIVSMDVAELLKANFFGFRNASDHELTDLANWPPANVLGGLGNVLPGKPVLTFMGDSFLTAWYAVRKLRDERIADKVEVCGIGSVGHDIIRFYDGARVLGPMTMSNKLVRFGISDVIVASTACINWDFKDSAARAGSRIIWTGKEGNLGLPDRIDDPIDAIVDDLVAGAPGAWVRDVEKAAEIAVRVSLAVRRKRAAFLTDGQAKAEAGRCDEDCDLCSAACPNGLLVGQALRKAKTGGLSALSPIEEGCYSCGRCESVCPQRVKLNDLLMASLSARAPEDNLTKRAGRGPVSRIETTGWAFGSLMGNCPGIFHILGCGDAKRRADLGWIAYELTWR